MPFDMEGVRLKLKLATPYFASWMYRLNPIPKPGIGTVAVDEHWNLYYDPDVDWSLNEQTAAIIHEIHHLTFHHNERAAGRVHKQWNVAADMEINDGLKDGIHIKELNETITLPSIAIYPDQKGYPDGLLAEEYYKRLDEEEQDEDDNGEGGDEGDDPQCGGGAGNPQEWEDGPGQNDTEPRLSDVEKRQIEIKAAEEAKTYGNLPGSLKRWVEDTLEPKVPWTSVLKATVRQAVQIVSGGETDYSWQKQNIRHEEEFVLPSLISYQPEVAVGIDTSGSVIDEVETFLAELRGIIRAHAQQITVVWGDTQVRGERKLNTTGNVKLIVPEGGGGTNMTAIIEHMEKLRQRPNILVLLTDSETHWPVSVGPKLIIVTTAEPGSYWWNKHPAYAEAVYMGEEK